MIKLIATTSIYTASLRNRINNGNYLIAIYILAQHKSAEREEIGFVEYDLVHDDADGTTHLIMGNMQLTATYELDHLPS